MLTGHKKENSAGLSLGEEHGWKQTTTDEDKESKEKGKIAEGEKWTAEKGKDGQDWYKDSGHKKHGWKNVYHKEEYGDSNKYHDIYQDKDWKKKWKKWDKGKDDYKKHKFAKNKKSKKHDVTHTEKGLKKKKSKKEKYKIHSDFEKDKKKKKKRKNKHKKNHSNYIEEGSSMSFRFLPRGLRLRHRLDKGKKSFSSSKSKYLYCSFDPNLYFAPFETNSNLNKQT